MIQEQIKKLTITACNVRMGIIDAVHSAKSGHPGGSLSSADILTYLYFKELDINPKKPKEDTRDRFVLSKGHAAPALYSTLANRGFYNVSDLKTLRHIGSFLQGHPNMNTVPGVDMSTGSLGQGVSAAVGMAKAAKIKNLKANTYALLGDGELAEGEVWEAFMFASHYNLDNFCAIIDRNGLQIDGKTQDVMNTAPLEDKLEAFGFEIITINGHDFNEIENAFNKFHECQGKPFCIIMNTIKGKGVSYMENNVGWHGKAPNDEEYKIAMDELKESIAEVEGR